MAFEKIKKFIGEDGSEIEQITQDNNEYYKETFKQTNNNQGNKMILLEPRAYSESQQIADHLKNRNSVVVNLKRVTAPQAKRIIDFLSGCIYAIGGSMQKIGVGIYLCTPKNVNVQGKITDDSEKKEKEDYEEIDL